MASDQKEELPVKAQLGLWDAVSIIIGIVIGATIFRSPPLIMNNVPGPWWGLGFWALGGVLSLIGALCYAELASTYPRSGGDYVYLTRAFGPWAGFLFGWAQLAVILTASIGSMAFVFSDYAAVLWQPANNWGIKGLEQYWGVLFAVIPVIVLSAMNVLGVVLGKWVQNILSALKVLGLAGIVFAGFFYGDAGTFSTGDIPKDPDMGLAMVLVLYAYGGWNDAAFVAAEVRNRRHITRALLQGTGAVMVIYLAVNAAYLLGLGYDGVCKSQAVAADVLEKPLGKWASRAMCVVVMISALGAINGLIFTGSRVYSALGAEHSIFAFLGRWHPRLKSPLWSLSTQALISLAMILAVGTEEGRGTVDWMLTRVRMSPLPWEKYYGGFNTLVAGTAPVFWGFFLLTGLSLFALRERDRDIDRPFSVPLFPLVPLLFCLSCFFMLYSAIAYAKLLCLLGVVPLLIGVPLYWLSSFRSHLAKEPASEKPE